MTAPPAFPQQKPCPACDATVLLTAGSRQGNTREVFDPMPSIGDRYNTRLADDLSYVSAPAAGAQNLQGRIPLYRPHLYSCPNGLKVPAGRPCPSWGSYRQAASGGKTAADLEVAVPDWPQPWQHIRGTVRDRDDLLSLETAAMPRRRVMAHMALSLWRATLTGQLSPAATAMGRRIRDPRSGDLVVEVTTAAKPGSERKGFGVLLACRREWVSAEAEYALAMGDEPDELSGDGSGAGEVCYVQYGPSPKDVARWQDGDFIAVLTDDRTVHAS